MNLSLHLPALIVIVPLFAAPLCIIGRKGNVAWMLTMLASLAIFVCSCLLLAATASGDAIRYALGGWDAPTGIEYYIDITNALIMTLVSGIGFITSVYARPIVDQEIPAEKHYLFYTGWLLCLAGLMGILITGDAFNVFVFLEISSLATYMMIALGNQRPFSYLSAFRYLIMGSVGASFILLGIGFLYAATGTLNMYDLSVRLAEIGHSRTVVVAFSFITIGILIKAAIFPLHSWLPNAYQYAPTAVTAFLAGTSTKVSLYILVRFYFHIFGADYSFGQMLLANVLLPAAIVGFVVMSIVALFQTDLKRLLAFSSIAQIGYILAAISLLSVSGLSASLLHIINHGIIKTALFMATGCIIYAIGSSQIKQFTQLGSKMPWVIVAFIISGVSLIGVPLTAGFVSKWNLIQASLEADKWPIAALILFSSIIAIGYIGKVVLICCFEKNDAVNRHDQMSQNYKVPALMLTSTWLLIGVSLYLGLQADNVVALTQSAAEQLLNGMQAPNVAETSHMIKPLGH